MLSQEKDSIKLLQRETEYHDRLFKSRQIVPVTPEMIQKTQLVKCYEGGSDWHSDNKMKFHRIIHSRGGWKDKVVLDYACGMGEWAIYYSLTGAKHVSGFDISIEGIKKAKRRQKLQEIKNVCFILMNASNLLYEDNAFDIVIGHGVLHHVLKYPNVMGELYRVMKPGTKAYFLENLSDFYLWRAWWMLKGQVEQGDIPLYAKDVRILAGKFENVEIIGDDLFYMLRSFLTGYKKKRRSMIRNGSLRKRLLTFLEKADQKLFFHYPSMRKYGGWAYIILEKGGENDGGRR